MRDPEGRVRIGQTEVIRTLHSPLAASHFLRTHLAGDLVERKLLVPFNLSADAAIASPRIPFVSYPHEWTNQQFHDAGRQVLEVCEFVLGCGWELKDASAWNVIFDGLRPILCDHTSFQQIVGTEWWAFGQFVRHFVLPLCVSRYRGLEARRCFQMDRDGLRQDEAKRLLGATRFLTRYWPLTISSSQRERRDSPQPNSRPYHRNLFALAHWLLDGVNPSPAQASRWAAYTEMRDHYSADAVSVKRTTVARWLTQNAPAWVVDFGCNTGEFSKLAGNTGASVVAIDADHDAVERMYRARSGQFRLYPVVANLDDAVGSRGWCGEEFSSLTTRLTRLADMTLMLGLTHHLAISHSIPFDEIARLTSLVTKRLAVVEFINEEDPLLSRLCSQRNRAPADFSADLQRKAFLMRFEFVDEITLPGGTRSLALLRLR